jgi:TatD DNase family protein
VKLYDTHAHLTDEAFRGDLDRVLREARSAGVIAINVVGFDLTTSRRAIELASAQPGYLHATVGIQPNSAVDADAEDWGEIERLAADPRVRGIGETGLDRYWNDTPWGLQQDYFERHIVLAAERELPLVIHMRECGNEIADQLLSHAANGHLTGVMHSFTGDWDLCVRCLDLGLMISFAGMVTFKNGAALREVAARVPADRLLIETDSPYLSPEPLRGRRPNEPARVAHTLRCLAEARRVRGDRPVLAANCRKGEGVAEIAAALTAAVLFR